MRKREFTKVKRLVSEDIMKIKPLKKGFLPSMSVIDVLIRHGVINANNPYLDWIVSSIGDIGFFDGQQVRAVRLADALNFAIEKIKEKK